MRKAGSSRIWGFSLACLYLLLVAGPLMLSFMLKADRATLGREMSLAFALLGVPILALQPVLAARIRVADRVFGLDSIYVFHQIMAMAAGFLLLAHPFLLASESSWSLLTSFAQPWPLLLGKVNLAILAVIIVISLFRNSLGTRYERWRKLHNVLAILLLTGAVIHSMTIGSDLKEGTVKAVWLLLAFLAAGCYVNHKIIGPWIRRKHPYRVTQVQRETRNVWTLTLASPKGEPGLTYLPGQFQFLTFNPQHPCSAEEHPFTIASSPTQEGSHQATIKESGDFTSGIGRIRPGDSIGVQGPFGRFSYLLYPGEDNLVLLAGGIGITPLISMLRHQSETKSNKNVILFYANRSEEDIVFREELDRLAAGMKPRLEVVHVLSHPGPQWTGEKGHIDLPLLRRHLPSLTPPRVYYVCGPPPMMSALILGLIQAGVPASDIRNERFDL